MMTPDDLAKILAAITTKNNADDPYHVSNSDAPGFSLVNTPLKGHNYLSWSQSVQVALRAKKKLGFINGKIKAPAPDSDDYDKWWTADSMVVSWLLNAISKDISDAFVFCKNAKVLWDELKQRYGESNGPMIYKIERDIAGYRQGNNSVTDYYTNLKRKWDELICLAPLPVCCEAGTAITDYDNNRRLMQFLMGLGDEYDNVKNQILLQDPLPSINKAYSMVMSVENSEKCKLIVLPLLKQLRLCLLKGDPQVAEAVGMPGILSHHERKIGRSSFVPSVKLPDILLMIAFLSMGIQTGLLRCNRREVWTSANTIELIMSFALQQRNHH